MTRMVSRIASQAAPVKGLNAFDSLMAMPEGHALTLRNLYAQPYGCLVRRGYIAHCELNGTVGTVMSHNTGTPKLYAFADDNGTVDLIDVTGINTPVIKGTGYANARWNFINFANAAGVSLVAVNGEDPMIWIQPNEAVVQIVAGDGSLNTIANVDPANFTQVYAHQKRLWFVEKNSTAGWYLPPDQIYGIATFFDFGGLMTRGGYISQIITWTLDDGNGSEDHLVALTTEGEVLVYGGLDPDGADNWALKGVYFAGKPVGNRAAVRFGGDIVFMTEFGLTYMSSLLESTKVNPTENNAAQMVQQIFARLMEQYKDLDGWEPFVFPGANMFLINVPLNYGRAGQLVMNHITKAWSEFIGYNASCWELHKSGAFFGGFGGVFQAWIGHTDGAIYDAELKAVAGEPVRAEAQTSFSNFGIPGVQKHFKMVRPYLISTGKFSVSIGVNANFNFDSPVFPAAFPAPEFGKWDEDEWDAAVWSGGLTTYSSWNSVAALSSAASLKLLIQTDAETYWPITDWLFEPGGVM